MKRAVWAVFLIGISFGLPTFAIAHGGGLDSLGCHHNKKQGGYHCHRGQLAGQDFSSKAEALKVLQGDVAVSPKPTKGMARVVDGDTIWIEDVKIRLHGIDAPESRQNCTTDGTVWPCGQEATQALVKAISGQPVTCKGEDRDKYQRLIAVCYVGYTDLNAFMVRNGWALAYRQYSKVYVDAEKNARDTRVGVWRGKFMYPWEWRKSH